MTVNKSLKIYELQVKISSFIVIIIFPAFYTISILMDFYTIAIFDKKER